VTGPQPHPVELLAQLDADALGPIAAARARRQLATDPRTAAARTAIAATRAELAAALIDQRCGVGVLVDIDSDDQRDLLARG